MARKFYSIKKVDNQNLIHSALNWRGKKKTLKINTNTQSLFDAMAQVTMKNHI